jgi:hypothetical protein
MKVEYPGRVGGGEQLMMYRARFRTELHSVDIFWNQFSRRQLSSA